MTVTIGAATFPTLTAQPYGYEGEARTGLTARRWAVSGLLTAAQWVALTGAYDTWRDARLADDDTLLTATVGTTISLTATGFGQSWSGIACWFTSAPSGEQIGALVQASVELVDANQALAVLLREQEKNRESSEALSRPSLGTVTVGSTTLTLVEPMERYQEAPAPQLTAAGRHYISGPLGATQVRQINGTTNAAGWSAIRSWYEAIVQTTPAAGTWFPIGDGPSASAEAIVEAGVKTTRYTVSLTLALIR